MDICTCSDLRMPVNSQFQGMPIGPSTIQVLNHTENAVNCICSDRTGRQNGPHSAAYQVRHTHLSPTIPCRCSQVLSALDSWQGPDLDPGLEGLLRTLGLGIPQAQVCNVGREAIDEEALTRILHACKWVPHGRGCSPLLLSKQDLHLSSCLRHVLSLQVKNLNPHTLTRQIKRYPPSASRCILFKTECLQI